jgi:hypothetical protein
MKTTIEIPDALFRRAISVVAERGIPLRKLIVEPLAEKLRGSRVAEKPWLKSFGKLRSLRAGKRPASMRLSKPSLKR